ncbi:MAG: thiamine phosphate synthase [Candidatus Aphodousia sp.]|nr:thiamine phosphate synthase [Sutterella sp.]MDY2900362.1 thiamine phosphate synthase [Candidatus Aphodousia sp.]
MNQQSIDYSLYLVLDPVLCERIGMVETAVRAVNAGATLVQLRAPQWKKGQIYHCALALKKALAGSSAKLIINDHADVALAVDADGVHVGQQDLPVNIVRQIIGPNKLLGLSINTAQQMTAVQAGLVDYVGIGPVLPTATKPDAAQSIGIEGLAALAAMSPVPSVAIGGIKSCHVNALAQTRINGLAVVSAICGQEDPRVATEALLNAWKLAHSK